MNIGESIIIAFDAIRAHKLRSSLTLLSISIGIFAIIGAGTAVTSLNNSVTGELANLGENSIIITRAPGIHTPSTWRKYRKRKELTYAQASEFKKRMESTDMISIINSSSGMTLQAGSLSTNKDVSMVGCDDYYFKINNVAVDEGRPFVSEDISLNRPVALIGNDVVVKLFPNVSPLGQEIRIKNKTFTVIGILKKKGATFGQSQDNTVLIPISFFSRYFSSEWEESVTVMVRAYSRESFSETMDEAIGILRSLRNVKPWEENSFEISTNESLAAQFSGFTDYIGYFGWLIGGCALLAAGVGIMNIMLVTVKERTREIGIRKAIGAQEKWILMQFIVEAVTLCQVGGLIGILFGLLGGLGISMMMQLPPAIPYTWIAFAVGVCTLIGLIFGAYPAWKAAKLDPIEALRYE